MACLKRAIGAGNQVSKYVGPMHIEECKSLAQRFCRLGDRSSKCRSTGRHSAGRCVNGRFGLDRGSHHVSYEGREDPRRGTVHYPSARLRPRGDGLSPDCCEPGGARHCRMRAGIGARSEFGSRARIYRSCQNLALRLSPRDTRAHSWMMFVGAANLHLGADAEALAWCRRGLEVNRNHSLSHFQLAAALALIGHIK